MKNILIGSQALAIRKPNEFKVRRNSDWDVISESELNLGDAKVEWHDPNVLGNFMLEAYTDDLSVFVNGVELKPLTLKGLSIVKRSHLWRDYFFDKHMAHYNFHLRDQVKNYTKFDHEMLDTRTQDSYTYFNEKHPNLNQAVKSFFDDYVEKKYDHDMLHSLFAHVERPMYTYMQPDPSKAWCDRKLWNRFNHQEKLWCVAEEAYVIATERFLVPSEWKTPSKLAFYKSLNKICTTLCSGFFRDFAIDNYQEVLLQCDLRKFQKVKSSLTNLSSTA